MLTHFCFGGFFPSSSEFRIGQRYNSPRDQMKGVEDPIETTLTTQGYLSDGNSHSIAIKGQGGDDFFDVVRNKQSIDLDGDSGNDLFVVRSFLALRIVNGTVMEGDNGNVTTKGGEGNDVFDVGALDTVTSYAVNAGVDIDGGTGTLFVLLLLLADPVSFKSNDCLKERRNF